MSYFTARLDSRPRNPAQPQRQQVYLRALTTLPGFDAYYGVFRSGVKRRPLADPVPGLPIHVLVRDSVEKGSDVNLATRLLVDGFNGKYEHAVVVSNDADFAGAMQYVRDDLALRVTLVNPDPKNTSPRELADAATLRQAPLEKPPEKEPAPRHVDGSGRSHHQASGVVTALAWQCSSARHCEVQRSERIKDELDRIQDFRASNPLPDEL